jgi:hypothetical protein
MAFNVTSDTVVKILVRRGLETERTATLLSEGELGYSIDTRRLFIGDGYTLGGQPVGNINFGVVANRFNFNSIAQPGDTLIENFCPYAYDGTVWYSTNPQIYNDITSNINSIEFTNANLLRVSPNCIGQGLALDYAVQSNGSLNNTLQKIYGTVQFDARYLSLCASAGSFYVGNVFNTKVKNNLQATLNVDQEIYVNDTATNPYQLQIYAKDPNSTANSLIEAVSGGLLLKGKTSVGLLRSNSTATQPQISINSSGAIALAPNIAGQGYTNPGNTVYGVTRFLSSAYFDENVWVAGTLSAKQVIYNNTSSTATSALSVFTQDAATDSAFIGNGTAVGNQTILRVVGVGSTTPGLIQQYLIVQDNSSGSGATVGVNFDPYFNSNFNFGVSGNTGFYAPAAGSKFHTASRSMILSGQTSNLYGVNTTLQGYNTTLQGDATLAIQSAGGSITITSGAGGASNYTDVQSNLRVTQDITAYYSDSRLKNILGEIDSSLNKISKLRGIYFTNNDTAKQLGIYTEGRKVGIIAQEVQQVLPEAVKPAPFDINEQGTSISGENYLTVQYEKLIPLMIQAINELNHKVETLEAKVK